MEEAASPPLAELEDADKREETTKAGTSNPSRSSLFPLFSLPSGAASPIPAPNPSSADNLWLSNASFTFDVSSLQVPGTGAVESIPDEEQQPQSSPESDDKAAAAEAARPASIYDLLPSSPSGSSRSSSSEDRRSSRKERRRRKKRKRERKNDGDGVSRKSGVRTWAGSGTRPAGKNYYFDAQGDKDNLAFGSLYRMDIARYKLQTIAEFSELSFKVFRCWKGSASYVDIEADCDAYDAKLRVGGRYYSVKYKALERNKDFKRVKVDKIATSVFPGEFIPLLDSHHVAETDGTSGEFEESWEDELIRRTKEFNQMTRDRLYDQKVWLAFAEFQDKIASTQSQKAARLQMLEKKISILEKAVDLNPDNEELLLFLLKSYQARDSTDTFLRKWETLLIQHSDSCKLWKEFLHVCQGEFSRFKVSEMRRTYANAIQALASACNKQRRQDGQIASLHLADSALVQLELDLVDVFISLCRFEWQAGYQELTTGLFQAEIEYSLFCPSLLLSSQSKHRLFEHFWNSGAARVGEDGAIGWSQWLEKDEQNRQETTVNDVSSETEAGGWSGWFELSSKKSGTSKELDALTKPARDDGEKSEENVDAEDDLAEEKIDTLLKKLGIDVDAEPNSEIKDAKTWNRWSAEELSRDLKQWKPVREKIGSDQPEEEDHGQLSGVILFEDISDYIFSLSTKEAQLSLVCQFIDFYGGNISQWLSSNKSSCIEKILSLETLPGSILEDIRVVYDLEMKTKHPSDPFELDSVLCATNDTSRKASLMKFIRNAILLILDILPRNHILEEALLRAEELSAEESSTCETKSFTHSTNPSRALAKSLLKKDRQDILLCGVYARSEAAYGNLDVARKIFDMALSSTDGLPIDLRKNVPLLYFWYAEMEVSVSPPSNSSELSWWRAVHILSCLGGNVKYTPFTSQPSSMQILRARQGFKEHLKGLRSTWSHGMIEEHSVALVCSASLFELLTNSWAAGIQIIEEAFPLALPERRVQSLHLESLWNHYIEMLHQHLKELKLSRVWKIMDQGLQMYPNNAKMYKAMIQVSYLFSVPSKVRLLFDECNQRNSSLVMWLFALSFEYGKADSGHRIHSLFERALSNEKLQKSVLLWRCYLAYEVEVTKNSSAARRVFFRAIHACPWSKRLWLDGFQKLSSILSAKELSDLQEVMIDKELNLRTDIYEILLHDEILE